MSKTTSQSRRERRNYERFLKKVNPQAYKQWKEATPERSKSLIAEQNEKVEAQQTEYFEAQQNRIINQLKDQGKSQIEIDRHIDIWARTVKVWGSNEKALSWKEAEAQYELENQPKSKKK